MSDSSDNSENEQQDLSDAKYGREGSVFECQQNIFKAAYVLDRDPNQLMSSNLNTLFLSKNHNFNQT